MAPHHLSQMTLLFGYAEMQIVSAPAAYRGQRASETTLRCALAYHTLSLPRLDPDMGKAKEVEGGPTRRRVGLAIGPLEAEIDEACLVRMQRKPVPSTVRSSVSPGPPLEEKLIIASPLRPVTEVRVCAELFLLSSSPASVALPRCARCSLLFSLLCGRGKS